MRRGASTPELIDALVDDIGLGGAVATLDAGRRGTNRSAQGDDLLALRQLARLHPDPGTFERWLSDQLARRRDPAGVMLSTVHRIGMVAVNQRLLFMLIILQPAARADWQS